MNIANLRRCTFLAALLLPLALVVAGCKAPVVEFTVENHTGKTVNLLEVDYPSASFGVDTLPAGAAYHYKLQFLDSGPIKVEYTEDRTQQYKSTGPSVHQNQQGRVQIVLNPKGKTEFHPQLNPPT